MTHKELQKLRATALLEFVGGPVKILKQKYPNIVWAPWCFTRVPDKYWSNLEHQKKALEWIEKQLKIDNWEDWYQVTVADLERVGGAGLLAVHHRSPCHMLQHLLPQHEWLPWRFKGIPKGFWDEVRNLRWYCDWLMRVRSIPSPTMLSFKSAGFFKENYGVGAIGKYEVSLRLTAAAFPGVF